ncbi:sister chromatid cohesion protein PDS5 homolog C [Ziziphus jujuba]|uniref:Sister chromatid cohesion protein PDS5 homolog C n=1 Tax=Ziziphus jujuba TaxID=326968 RepID=A0ABM3IM28_ZIZJJ|nr:sister chromatid cohesion protein PDS5 homolog C [Ziziphus jujuba]
MASSDKELEAQLLEAGNKLVDPPSSIDELLPLLDKVENCLSRVEQSPTKSMQNALSPSLKALVADQLLRHTNVDVKVAVASCISEITRITAPDAPYDDDQMKEVFQLIVSSFENLSDKSSRSYAKRTSILETVAKVRSCVVMLDLECDALILEMFEHFLATIRDYHPENVFSSMETIMTLVLEESEDIPPDLLAPILASVKKNNEEVLPISRKLGERVLESCATKLKPYLAQAVKTLEISLDDYSKIVTSICEDASDDAEQNDVHASDEHMDDENKSVKTTLGEGPQEDKERATETTSLEQVDPAVDKSLKPVVSNGVAQTGEGDSLVASNSIKNQEHDQVIENSKDLITSSNTEPDGLDAEKEANTEEKPEQTTKKRGKKTSSSVKSTEPSESPRADDEKENEKLPDQRNQSEDIAGSPSVGPSVDAAVHSETNKSSDVRPSSPKALENDSANVAPASPSESLPDESRSRKAGRQKKKDNSDKEAVPAADNVSQKADEVPQKVADGTSDSEVKANRRTGKKVSAILANENRTSTVADASKKESGTTSDSEAKPLKHSSKKVDASSKNDDGSSLKQSEDKKKRSRGKALSEKDVTKAAAKDDDKEILSSPKSAAKSSKGESHLEETPKTSSKRKRPPGKGKESEAKNYGEDLVGSSIKVWWPKDQMFYDGIVESFDPVKKKHKVAYTDGDEETLNLKREKWEFIEVESRSDAEEESDQSSPDSSTELPLKKKVKINTGESTRQGKSDASTRRGGGASSSKSKVSAAKSGRKSKEGNKLDGKSKDDSSKSGTRLEDEIGGKSKDQTSKSGGGGGKSANVDAKGSSKSKSADTKLSKTAKSKSETSTPSTKSKQEKAGKSKQGTPKNTPVSKGKSPSGKSNANGTGKTKSGSSKLKETEDVNESSTDSERVTEITKGKPSNSSKVQGSESKTGKKRRRGTKS